MRVEHAAVPDVALCCLRSPLHWDMKNPAVVQAWLRERRGIEESVLFFKITEMLG